MVTVTAVTGDGLVVEPGDTLLILTSAAADERERMWHQLSDAMPEVTVQVVHVPEGGPTLRYRPTRLRVAEPDLAPPCVPDPRFITGWRCDPRRTVHMHGGYVFQSSDVRTTDGSQFTPDGRLDVGILHGRRAAEILRGIEQRTVQHADAPELAPHMRAAMKVSEANQPAGSTPTPACSGAPGCACPTIHNAARGCACDCHVVWREHQVDHR